MENLPPNPEGRTPVASTFPPSNRETLVPALGDSGLRPRGKTGLCMRHSSLVTFSSWNQNNRSARFESVGCQHFPEPGSHLYLQLQRWPLPRNRPVPIPEASLGKVPPWYFPPKSSLSPKLWGDRRTAVPISQRSLGPEEGRPSPKSHQRAESWGEGGVW